ncbi:MULTISPECIES: hypothetical protein [Bacillaceae]|uniref:hypothetical protein n=1 Tax=Bacillaceae TaxID=186817 RepID=UPI002FFD8ACB
MAGFRWDIGVWLVGGINSGLSGILAEFGGIKIKIGGIIGRFGGNTYKIHGIMFKTGAESPLYLLMNLALERFLSLKSIRAGHDNIGRCKNAEKVDVSRKCHVYVSIKRLSGSLPWFG